jgi:hypothetical protein
MVFRGYLPVLLGVGLRKSSILAGGSGIEPVAPRVKKASSGTTRRPGERRRREPDAETEVVGIVGSDCCRGLGAAGRSDLNLARQLLDVARH